LLLLVRRLNNPPPTPSAPHQNKDASSLRAALKALLGRHGLEPGSSDKDIRRVRLQLEKAKDLEGIDASNILATEGRRPRRAAAAAVNFQ
jgi:hypothetical protein